MVGSANKRRIGFVVGTRPEAIKLAPVIIRAKTPESGFDVSVISTGQHKEMLAQVFDLFGIVADVNLEIMKPNQGLEHITAEAVRLLPDIYTERKLEFVFVQGDTSTAFAAALGAFYRRIKVGHVEAGLRTFDKAHPFPEEINRRLIGQTADLHFAPTSRNETYLLQENVPQQSIFVTGNTVVDALLEITKRNLPLEDPALQKVVDSGRRILLVTAHRRENFGKPLEDICDAILDLTSAFADLEVVYPVHLNPNVQNIVHSKLAGKARINLVRPLDYRNFTTLLKHCYLVLTDSGGVQEEAPSLGKPVLVLRETTERPEAVDAGVVKIVGTERRAVVENASLLLSDPGAYKKMSNAINPYGDGLAAGRTIDGLKYFFGASKNRPAAFSAE